jgi:hypothetical protein
MAAKHEEPNLTPEEKHFRDCMITGDDFTKIEIYRSAASWYKKALDLKPGDEEALNRLVAIQGKIRKENIAIYTIVAVFAVIAFMVVILIR